MSDRRLGHDLDLGDAGGTMAVGCPDAVAARITTTDYQDFLAFAIDDVFRGNGDAFEEAVLLSQQFEGEMNAFQVTAFDRKVARYFRTDGDADGIEVLDNIPGCHFFADHRVYTEFDSFFLHQADTAVDDVFPQFEIGNAETEQATR